MVEYSKVNVKLSDTQLKKTKTMNLKMVNGNDLPHKLLLTRRQRTKLRNTFNNNNNISNDLKLYRTQIFKI